MPPRYLLPTLGLSLIGASSLGYFSLPEPVRAGRLVPIDPLITWRGAPDQVGSAGSAEAEFVLRNAGEAPIEILSVASGCGCAVPKVEPTHLEPGASTTVKVAANPPPVGERIVAITVHTNSPLTPDVPLHLRMVGSRRPPFLLSVLGDLAYREADISGTPREVVARTIETGPCEATPHLDSDLDFLSFRLIEVKEEPYLDPGTTLRTYRFEVSLTGPPPARTFSGTVRVHDPWDQSLIKTIPAYRQEAPPVRVIPTHLSIEIGSPTEGVAEVSFLVQTEKEDPDLRVERAPDAGCRVTVDPPIKLGDNGRLLKFVVRMSAGKVDHQTPCRLILHSALTPDPISIPIEVTTQREER
jgi:hypothetical protein